MNLTSSMNEASENGKSNTAAAEIEMKIETALSAQTGRFGT